jgi:glyceraldehyde 3-phosphate dehydrogenase
VPLTVNLKHLRSRRWDEWTSARIVGDPHSSVVDLPLVQMIGDRLVSVAALYGNA